MCVNFGDEILLRGENVKLEKNSIFLKNGFIVWCERSLKKTWEVKIIYALGKKRTRDHGKKGGKLKRHGSMQGLQFSEPPWKPMVVLFIRL